MNSIINLLAENGKVCTFIPDYHIVGYTNEEENIDILVKDVMTTMEAKQAMDKCFDILASGNVTFHNPIHQFHLTREELLEM